MAEKGFIIVLDFDGTVVTHAYPAIGKDIGAVPVLQRLIDNGHKIILNTMRSYDSGGEDTLTPAIDWFKNNKIPLFGINENPEQKSWTSSPKVYGNLYIDDAALGSPLKYDEFGIPYIDWSKVSVMLFQYGLLNETDLIYLLREGIISPELIQCKTKNYEKN